MVHVTWINHPSVKQPCRGEELFYGGSCGHFVCLFISLGTSSFSSMTQGTCLAVGFAAGSTADSILALPPRDIFSRALSQVDQLLRRNAGPCTCCKKIERSGGNDSDRAEVVQRGTPHHHFAMSDTSGASTKESRAPEGRKLELDLDCCKDPQNPIGTFVRRKFKGSKALCEGCNPASTHFVKGYMADWSKDPFILGGYSYPSVGATGCRETLAEQVSGRLFFAGEATHHGVNPCLQAAIDSGHRAANEALLSVTQHSLL